MKPIDVYLGRMVELGASDLYLVVGAPPTAAVEKKPHHLGEKPLERADLLRLVTPLLEGHPFRGRDLDLVYAPQGVRGRFRLSIYRERGELALVARLVRLDIPSLEELELPPVLARMGLEPRGLLLVTGAAATGKSTTLAAVLDHRAARIAGHIVTIEDPIEFVHAHRKAIVSQREVGIDVASFGEGLRSALRQAPDVLLVGEVRDQESAEAALRIAETGHLVLTTLHATNTVQAIERLLGLFPAERHAHVLLQLSFSLVGVVSQRLVQRSDRPRRIAAVEVLVPTERVRELVRRGDLVQVAAVLAEGGGDMRSFDDALHALVASGRVARDEAVRHADRPNDFLLRFRLQEAKGPGLEERKRLRLV